MKHLKTFKSYSLNEENIFKKSIDYIKGAALKILAKNRKFKEGFAAAQLALEKDSRLQTELEKLANSNLKDLESIKTNLGENLENLKDENLKERSSQKYDDNIYPINEDLNQKLTQYFPQLANYSRLLGSLILLATSFIQGTSGTGESAGETIINPFYFAGFVILLLWAMFKWIPNRK
jgi:hypothetical protein